MKATYNDIPVEIINRLPSLGENRPRRLVLRAIEGEPFTKYTHGGWCNTDMAIVTENCPGLKIEPVLKIEEESNA